MPTEIMIRPTIPDEETASQAAAAVEALQRIIEENAADDALAVRQDNKSSVGDEAAAPVPTTAVKLALEVLEQIAQGSVITVSALADEISTHLAADLLNVRHSYLENLLEEGEIPYRGGGDWRGIRVSDLLEYKRADHAKRSEILDELSREAQELGLDYC